MGMTLTPNQRVAGAAATLAVCFAGTLIVWRWPDSSTWLLGAVLVLAVLVVIVGYRAERKAEPPD